MISNQPGMLARSLLAAAVVCAFLVPSAGVRAQEPSSGGLREVVPLAAKPPTASNTAIPPTTSISWSLDRVHTGFCQHQHPFLAEPVTGFTVDDIEHHVHASDYGVRGGRSAGQRLRQQVCRHAEDAGTVRWPGVIVHIPANACGADSSSNEGNTHVESSLDHRRGHQGPCSQRREDQRRRSRHRLRRRPRWGFRPVGRRLPGILPQGQRVQRQDRVRGRSGHPRGVPASGQSRRQRSTRFGCSTTTAAPTRFGIWPAIARSASTCRSETSPGRRAPGFPGSRATSRRWPTAPRRSSLSGMSRVRMAGAALPGT